jgi:protein gp37
MSDTKIEWATKAWNPIIGCSKKSAGCDDCLAIRETWRFAHSTNAKIRAANEGLVVMQNGRPNWTGKIRLIESRLDEPLRWKEPQRIFACSKTDLFHEHQRFADIDLVVSTMLRARDHRYLTLTKRPDNALRYWSSKRGHFTCEYQHVPAYSVSALLPLDNVWFGCSVENQREADNRREPMRKLAEMGWFTWVSHEPALGPIDWSGWEFIRWMVSGGESGKNARPAHPDWFRSTRDWCAVNNIPWFFKQSGDWIEDTTPFAPKAHQRIVNGTEKCGYYCDDRVGHVDHKQTMMVRVGKKRAGAMLDGREWREFPEAKERG